MCSVRHGVFVTVRIQNCEIDEGDGCEYDIVMNVMNDERLTLANLMTTFTNFPRQTKSNGLNDNGATGILRRVVPEWLKETPLSNFVLAFSSAQKTHGGTGALYVLLRRQVDNRGRG